MRPMQVLIYCKTPILFTNCIACKQTNLRYAR